VEEFLKHALFGMSGLLGIVCAVLVVTRKNPIYSALFLIVLFGTIAVDFFMLQAEFLGFMQLLVYAGAIMVLYLFVIMLINPREDTLPDEGAAIDRWVAFGVAVLIFGMLMTAISQSEKLKEFDTFPAMAAVPDTTLGSPEKTAEHGTISAFGYEMFTQHLFVFELTSVLILIAIVGAVHLSLRPRRRKREDNSGHPDLLAAAREEHAHV